MTTEEPQATNDPSDEQGEEETELTGQPMDSASTARKVGQSTMVANDGDTEDNQHARQERERQATHGDAGPG